MRSAASTSSSPAASWSGRSTEHLVKLDLEFHKLDDLAAMIVGYKDGSPVRLRDIAEIEDGLTDYRQLARLNGQPAVGVGIVKVPNTNTVEIIDRVLERVEQRHPAAAAAGARAAHRAERQDVHRRHGRRAEERT